MIALEKPDNYILPLDTVIHGDALAVLRGMPDNSVDAIVTDPPSGIGFMSAKWDTFDDKTHRSRQAEKDAAEETGKWLDGRGTLPYGFSPSLGHSKKERENFISFLREVMTEALRVLRPGGHALVWALPRTSHWTALALEDAGFEVRDCVYSITGQGFPKSLDVRKSAQKAGLACTCQESVIQYHQHLSKESVSHGILSSLQQAATDQAAKPEIEVLLNEMYGPGSSYLANAQDVRDMREAMEAIDPFSSSTQYNMFPMQGQEDITSQERQAAQTSTHDNLQALSDGISVDQWTQDSELLQLQVCSTTPNTEPAIYGTSQKDGSKHEGQDERTAIWSEQSSVEGRSNLLQETWQLHQRKIRSLSTGIHSDGKERRLCDGASPSDGSTSREMSISSGSSTPHRSRPAQQSYQQSSVIPQQHSPQTCGRCGKPIIEEGLGSALKPAVECWWLVRKPLAEPSIAANVLKYGTGGLNVDACRVGGAPPPSVPQPVFNSHTGAIYQMKTGQGRNGEMSQSTQGRFPSHLLLSHSLFCVPTGTKRVRSESGSNTYTRKSNSMFIEGNHSTGHGYNDLDGYEQVEAWECSPECPIRALDEQSGVRKSGAIKPYEHHNTSSIYGGGKGIQFKSQRVDATWEASEGGASRYFTNFPPDDFTPFQYCSKSSRRERNAGCEGLPYHSPGECTDRKDGSAGLNNPRAGAGRTSGTQNNHPTVKSTALMSWLIRLITPPGGIVLDCFAGSGSTCVAAIHEGVHFIGIEQSEEYCTIARCRVQYAQKHRKSELWEGH